MTPLQFAALMVKARGILAEPEKHSELRVEWARFMVMANPR